jgi:hypothetical protein
LTAEKHFDRLFEAALQKMGVALKRDEPAQVDAGLERHMKAMNRIQKKKRSHPFVKIFTAAAEYFQVLRLGQQLVKGSPPAKSVKRLVARGGIGGGDYFAKMEGHGGMPND